MLVYRFLFFERLKIKNRYASVGDGLYMPLTELLENPAFIMFGGKGGVGKTSMSAATSLRFADDFAKRRVNEKILIFTTDPAPSLADSFGQKIGSEPTAIEGVKNLFAMEIDAKKVLEEFKKEYGEDILDILQQGTYLADEEAEEIFSLDIPGLDEVMGLKKITDFMESKEYGSTLWIPPDRPHACPLSPRS